MEKITELLEKYPDLNRDSLIPILQEVQDKIGYIPEDAVKEVSSRLGLPMSKIFGLATFYNQFRFSPSGKYHIQICHGTSCHIKGGEFLLKEIKKLLQLEDGEITRDGIFSLEVLSCIGACGQSPVISINGEYYEKVDKLRLREIITFYKELEDRR